MSNPREEMSLQKCFKFFPGLKNDHSRGEVLPKNALLFSEFLKNALFSRFFLRFSRSAFFLFTVLVFFQECFFFSSWLYFFVVLLRTSQRDNIFLAVGSLYWPTFDAFLITLTLQYGVWFFMYFIQILVFMIAWNMQFQGN